LGWIKTIKYAINQSYEYRIKNITTEITQIVSQFGKQFRLISESDLRSKANPKKWSKQEIIGHLIDSRPNNLRRLIVGQYIECEKIIYDQDIWVAANNYEEMSTNDTIFLWELINKRIAAVLDNVPLHLHGNVVDTSKDGKNELTLFWLAEDYVKHMRHHINQIISNSIDMQH